MTQVLVDGQMVGELAEILTNSQQQREEDNPQTSCINIHPSVPTHSSGEEINLFLDPVPIDNPIDAVRISKSLPTAVHRGASKTPLRRLTGRGFRYQD